MTEKKTGWSALADHADNLAAVHIVDEACE